MYKTLNDEDYIYFLHQFDFLDEKIFHLVLIGTKNVIQLHIFFIFYHANILTKSTYRICLMKLIDLLMIKYL
jgi:hypothetical protein